MVAFDWMARPQTLRGESHAGAASGREKSVRRMMYPAESPSHLLPSSFFYFFTFFTNAKFFSACVAEQQKHLTVNQASDGLRRCESYRTHSNFQIEEHGVNGNMAVSKTVAFGSTPNAPANNSGEYAKMVWHRS